MAAESFTNFATTLVATTALTTTSTSFTVVAGTGVSFPASNFLVVIDAEIMLISRRSTDTFTIGTRGFDGTVAAAHAVGATVQLCTVAYNLNHIWQNVADAYNPDVPPAQSSLSSTGLPTGSPSIYDSEFGAIGNWVLYPSNSSLSIASAPRSMLTFVRSNGDNAFYTAYQPFPVSGAFTITTKVSDAINVPINQSGKVEYHFFVSDSTNPSSGTNAGNRFHVDVVTSAQDDDNAFILVNSRYATTTSNVSGKSTQVGQYLPVPFANPVYLRISYDGTSTWTSYIGDGLTYTVLSTVSKSFTPQSMGFQFLANGSNSNSVTHVCVVDFVRCVLGSVLPQYGV